MARKTKPDITMQQAMDAHLDYIRATFSVNTLNDYRVTHRLFLEFLAGEEVLFREADEELVQEFLTTMRETPISRQRGAAAVANPTMGYRKPKTVQNMHTALCSLWRWGVDRGYVAENIMGDVRRPKVASVPIVPLGNGELVKLFRACVESRAYHNKPLSTNYRPTAERDRAIVALLTETMLRVSELSDLRQRDVKISNGGGQVWVEMGKGGKSRRVPFGRECAKILRDYLVVGKGSAVYSGLDQAWTGHGGQGADHAGAAVGGTGGGGCSSAQTAHHGGLHGHQKRDEPAHVADFDGARGHCHHHALCARGRGGFGCGHDGIQPIG